jgi:heme-degrading monooxygenase HmoA
VNSLFQEYLDIAAQLRPLLDSIEGFVSIERFESLSEPGKLLSLSIWRDEQAAETWRQLGERQVAQARGRADVFQNYRLRVVSVIRDYGQGFAPPLVLALLDVESRSEPFRFLRAKAEIRTRMRVRE